MLYFTLYSVGEKAGQVASAQEQRITDGDIYRGDFKTFERAVEIATQATAAMGSLYIAIDSGPNVSPRYDVIAAPKVGDKVSKTINGDYYPCGEIKHVSRTLKKITTTEGDTFYRRGESGRWVQGGCWSMVQGHIDRRNQEF